MTLPNTAEHSASGQPDPSHPEQVTAVTTWAELSFARACPPWLLTAAGLSSRQRVLLALVLFGPVTYRQAADSCGLPPAEVSRLCSAALRQLAAACRSAEAGQDAG